MRQRFRALLAVSATFIVLAMAACGTIATTATTTFVSPTVPVPTATATVVGVCAQVKPTPSSNSGLQVSGPPSWQGVPFPPSVMVLSYSAGATDGIQHSDSFEVYGLCADNTTPADVQALYRIKLPQNGWTQSATFPYQDNITASCGDSYCWQRPTTSSNTTDFLSLESVHASGTSTLFTLRHVSYTVNS